MSDHPASALLEMLVHFEIRLDDIPNMYQLLAIDLPDKSGFATVDITDLPSDWQKNLDVTQTWGDRWLGEKRAALLRVPSAIVPAAFNWLLNPSHADAGQARIAEIIRAALDPRLLRAD